MKKQFLILVILMCRILSFGQNDSTFFLNEFDVSINHVTTNNNNRNNYGFGIGANHIFLSDKQVNIVVGMEYNMTVQYFSSMYEGHFASLSDITFYIHSFSIPVTARLNFGHKTKFFIEAGTYLDMNMGAKEKGRMHTYFLDDDNTIINSESDINRKTDISALNYGISAGLGISISISKIRIFIKPEYKFGFAKLYSGADYVSNNYLRVVIGIKVF
jgi:hypothetical protein